jgi:glycosyltransferase involved in cell wall biosynthesis
VPDKLIRLVYNGVDSEFWDMKKISRKLLKDWRKKYGWGDRFVLLYYGHSGKSKGLDYLIDALPAIFTQYPDILFVCNLIHAKRDLETKQKIRALWYHKNIQLFSWFSIDSLRTLVAASDCVVAPSLSEGFGSVHAEVSSLWKPLITSYVASIPEVVHGKVVFVEPQSSQAIVDAVIKVKNDQFEHIDAKAFPREKTIDGIEQLYTDFIW